MSEKGGSSTSRFAGLHLVARLVALATGAPRRVFGFALLLTLAALAVVATRFDMSTDTSSLISPTVPWRQHEQAFDAAFPQLRDSMLVVIDGETPELAEDAAIRLSDALAHDAAHVRNVRRPDGGDFFNREGLLFGSDQDVRDATAAMVKAQPLLGPLAADPSLTGVAGAFSAMLDGVDNGSASLSDFAKPMQSLARSVDGRLAGKPATFSWQKLLAANGAGGSDGALAAPTRRLLLVRPVLDFAALTPGSAAGEAILATAGKLGIDQAHGVRVRLTGDVPLADQDFASLQENIGLVGAIMVAAMLLTLWLATRSVRMVGAIMGTIILGLLVTLALGLLAVGRLNLISIAFIPLFVGLGVDFGIQICVRFAAERMRKPGAYGDGPPDVRQALSAAAQALSAPLTLAAGAIVLGFAAFLPTAYVGIAELGVISAIGMVVALLFSVTVLPAVLVLLDPPVRDLGEEGGIAALAPLDRLLVRRRKAVLGSFVVAMVISIALLPLVQFDFNPMDMRDPEAEAMQTLADLTRDPDRTPDTISVLAHGRAQAQDLVARLAKLPEARRVLWIDSFVPEDQQGKLATIADAQGVLDFTLNPFTVAPAADDAALVATLATLGQRLEAEAAAHPGPGAQEARALGAALTRLAKASPASRASVGEMVSRPLTVMLDQMRASLTAEAVSEQTLPADLARDWRAPGDLYRIEVVPAGDTTDNGVLTRFRAAVAQVTPAISGMPVITQAAASTIAWAFVQAGIIAFVLVSGLLLVVLRSVREVAFTLAPVVLSIFLTLGTCVLIGQPLNFANIIAFPLLFGVGVAFHIYFVMAWRAGARDLLQSSLARAVLFSAFATGTAFGSLWLSRHPGTASMGKILMISLIWTLICALVFEPALLGPPKGEGRAD